MGSSLSLFEMEGDTKDEWHQKKSICYVFSDVFSRSPNQDFVQKVLSKLYSSKVLDKKDVEETVGKVLLKNSQDESSDSENEDETTFDEKLQHEIGGLIYSGLSDKIFKVPEEEKLYLLRKRPETEQSYPEEVENEFSSQVYPAIDYHQLENSNLSLNESDQEFVQNVLKKVKKRMKRRLFLKNISVKQS